MKYLIYLIILLSSCSKWDDYKKYTADGEIVYAGKLDSVKILSGKNRVQINARFNADPLVNQVRIFWNDKRDSAVYDVKRSTSGDYFQQTVPLAEGLTTFVIHTYDVNGNRSVPVSVVGRSYGDIYRRKLTNRVIANIRYFSNNTTINWEPTDATVGALRTELEYTVNGTTKTVSTPIAESSVFEGLPNTTANLRFRTVFKPDSTSIDTFTVAWKDTTVVPLKNNNLPFVATDRSGRWGNLAEWNANAAIKSHGGYGGWDEWNGNIFNIESGWGSPAVTNGKLWQTFTLPAGTYTFAITDLRDTNLGAADKTYLVVAEGTELPNVEDINTAFASVKIENGKPMSVKFTVTQTKLLTLGYLTTQVDGTPGRFCNIRALNVYVNH